MELSSDTENDDEQLMDLVQRLPVSKFDDYDPNVPPQNGADYLRRVQLEAMTEPDIKVAQNLNIKSNFGTMSQLEESQFVRCPENVIPNEVIESLLDDFEEFRYRIDQCRLRMEENEQPLLPKRTKTWWHQYCFGPVENKAHNYQTNIPSLALISRLTQHDVRRLLRYHYEWMTEESDDDDKSKIDPTLSLEQGFWIYSLLAALDSVQVDDTYCLLRQISRLCSRLRKNSTEQKHLATLNLIILLIGHFFGQKDLLD